MGNRGFFLMAFIFVIAATAYWWFNLGPGMGGGGPQARSFQVYDAWPTVMQAVRPFLRDTTQGMMDAGVPSLVATVLVVCGVLLAGYMIAWVVLRIVAIVFSGANMIGGLFQYIIAPLWQVGLTLISALQTIEWFRDKGFIAADVMTPAYTVFAILSLAMMYGLSKARGAAA